MTKDEFYEYVCDFSGLIDFCHEYCIERFIENIISEDERDDIIDEYIESEIRNTRWYDIRVALDDIESGFDFYRHQGDVDFTPLDDYDFDELVEEVLSYCYEEGIVDYESDEDSDNAEEESIENDTDDDAHIIYDPFDPEEYRGDPDTDDEFFDFIEHSVVIINADSVLAESERLTYLL